MIIEATPRLRDGPLEGYTPSPIDKTNLDSNFASFRYSTPVNARYGPDQVPDSLVKSHISPQRAHQCRRSVVKLGTKVARSYYYHPYTRPGKRKAEKQYWDSFLVSQKCRQNESFSCFNFVKSSSHFQEFSKLGRREQRFNLTPSSSSTFIPFFTANANENNDNCPKIEFGRNETVNDVRPQSENHICDVEIEDLSSEATAAEESYCWRQRRKSFNTNPLSSTSARKLPDHPPNLLPLDNLSRSSSIFSKEHKGHFEVESHQDCYRPTIYEILGINPEENKKLYSPSGKKASPHSYAKVYANYNQENTEDPSYINGGRNNEDVHRSSIERLVNFFESNSSDTSSKDNLNQNPPNFTCDYANKRQTNCTHTKSFASSIHFPVANTNIRSIQKERNCSSPEEFPQQCSKKSPFDLSHLLRDSHWNSVIKTSLGISRTSPTLSTTQPRRVYNNNGNAASATIESRFGWQSNNNYRRNHFQSISCLENEKGLFPSTYSNPSERGRSLSSLSSRVSSEIELIDLESTRLSSWPGTHSIPDAFARRRFPQAETTHNSAQTSDHLIDLQATSKRTACRHNTWFVDSSAKSDLSKKSTQRKWENQLTGFSLRIDKGSSNEGYQEDRFKNSFSRDRVHQENRINSNHLSTNNHHNTPGICDFNKCYSPLTVPNSAGPNSERQRFGNRQEILSSKQFPFGDFNLHHNLLDPNFFPSDSYDMGCIQSIAKSKVSPDRCHQNVIVENIQASIDRTPTEIEEKSPIVLRYRTPYFRASAHVIVPPIPRKETWTVGWIQACDSMKFINQYGDLGNSSWEIPALKDRRITAVSDSDGVSYPWYGNTTEIATLEGPTDTSRSLTLRMNDNFYPSVTWDIPVSEGSEAHLTHIVRDQSFTTWLAAVNQTTGRIEVLRTVKWHFYLEIDVDPTHELGKRARIVSPLEQKQPIILKDNTEPIYITSPARRSNSGSGSTGGRQRRLNRRHGAGGDNNSNNHTNCIPKSALVRPSANNAQTLIWRPTREIPVVVVPAKEEYKENNEVVWFTRTPLMHGHDQNVRILSKQEMIHLKKSFS